MTKFIYTLVPAFLLVFFTLTSFSGCKKPQSVCGVENPLTELEWLSQIIANWEENLQNGENNWAGKIYQCTYEDNKIGFLIEPCSGCPDAGYSFWSCDGTMLCGGGGHSGEDTCGEFNIDSNSVKLIYTHN